MKLLIFLPLIIFTGCSTPFLRSTSGCFTSVGISIPNSDVAGFQIAQYLSGNSLVVNSPAKITYQLNVSTTNSYFGLVRTQSNSSSTIQVEP